jgi:signal peptidase I
LRQRVLIENLSGKKHPIVLTPYQHSKDSFDPVAIPPEYYLMMGDNRDNSADSRYFGPVERWRILGRAAVVAASFNLERDNRPR